MSAERSTLSVRLSRLATSAMVAFGFAVVVVAAVAGPDVAAGWLAGLYEGVCSVATSVTAQATR
ncbi:hypothetical protein ACM0AZ_25060 [Mycobacteroides abscessus subsp. massiliense]|uniref:hypothetical protein n=1 Tax=Mycobacteroides abscessus TaxID=36809 RepID=UPI0011C47473|nr:hypothetical protein [Mycobacteroides abscessus]MBN7567102.1 hypothetical protein [Mycobacteroides abscessus subsp. massiliense]